MDLKTVLSNIPAIVKFIETVSGMARDLRDSYDAKLKLAALEKGHDQAEKTGDTSGVENAFKQPRP